jgi:DNA polymerase (family 10)
VDTTVVGRPRRELDNAAVADRLESLASLLDLSGASYYSVRAYRRAGELIRSTPVPVAELVRNGRVRELRGIGPAIEARLRELVETGSIAELEELESEVQPELVGLGRLVGLSPRRMVDLGRALGVRSAAELREAARDGRLRQAPGIGPSTEAKIAAALGRERPAAPRGLVMNRARELADAVARAVDGIAAGDIRRACDLSERFAVVHPAADSRPVLERFRRAPGVVSLLERRERWALGVTVEGVPVELYVPPPDELGTALVRATGSEGFVASLGELPPARTEGELFATLGLPFVPPELREGERTGGAVPTLVERGDIRGDLHCHTLWSDGKASVLEMGHAARDDHGYDYIAICDHTVSVRVVPGLDADAVRRQGEEIALANEELAPFRILRGIECDILADGTLDLPDNVLDELDWVQASVHAGQRQSREQLTMRMTEAARHPAVRCISHPQGRILNHRPPNAVDLERLFDVCLETGTAVETNGLPDRIDLSADLLREAIATGVAIVCSTDAHSVRGLDNMVNCVGTARRAGATADEVVNARPLAEVMSR